MNLPKAGSRQRRILVAFLSGPMTIYQAEEVHGSFVSAHHPDGIEHVELVQLYAELVERGLLIREGIKYRLVTRAHDMLTRESQPGWEGQVATPRTRNIYEGRDLTRQLLDFFRLSPFRFAI